MNVYILTYFIQFSPIFVVDVESLPLTPEMENPYFKILNELEGKIYIGGKKQVVIYDPDMSITNSTVGI